MITHFSVRGLASGMVIMGVTLVTVVLALMGWWDEIFRWFGRLQIQLNLGAYFWFSTVMFAIWSVTVFALDRKSYWEITPGQLTQFSFLGGGSRSYNAQGMGLEKHRDDQRGWGIVMATDIAFVVGCLAVMGSRVPASLRVLLLSLAIVDDIGAILVIALGYTETLSLSWLAVGGIGVGLVVVMQRLGIRSMGVYTLLGVAVWLGFHQSGIHATIAGVILGLLTPSRPYLMQSLAGDLLHRASEVIHGGDWDLKADRAEKIRQYRQATREAISPLEYLIYLLHPWVAFLIMPVFALANAGISFQGENTGSSVTLAVILGLAVGKPVGILLLSWLSLKLGLAQLPKDVSWRQLVGGGCLAGIGFTMALFIADLAFREDAVLQSAKIGILVGSAISAILGMVILVSTPRQLKQSPIPLES